MESKLVLNIQRRAESRLAQGLQMKECHCQSDLALVTSILI